MSIELVMPSNHLILCHPLLLPPSIFLSIRVFSNESVLHIRWPKYWSFSFSICPSSEYSELISFRFDWFDLFAVPGTLKRKRSWPLFNVCFFNLFFLPHHMACGLLAPWPGIEPAPRSLALDAQSFNHCTTKKLPNSFYETGYISLLLGGMKMVVILWPKLLHTNHKSVIMNTDWCFPPRV